MSLVVISATLGVLGADRSACAQSVDAGALFDQGNDLMQQGKLAQACEAFEASNRAEPTAGTLIQLGKCLWRLDRIASAWSAYKDALSRARDPGKRKIATDAVAALESRLSYLTISVPDKNRLDR
jgi:tetratricopeptide (TPR) repeat protein